MDPRRAQKTEVGGGEFGGRVVEGETFQGLTGGCLVETRPATQYSDTTDGPPLPPSTEVHPHSLLPPSTLPVTGTRVVSRSLHRTLHPGVEKEGGQKCR